MTWRCTSNLLKRAGVLVLAGMLVIAPGCEQGEDRGSGPAEALPLWTLGETLEIGSPDATGYDLTEISSVAVSGQGLLYVAQSRDPGVRVFEAATGAFVDRFGRGGTGPGELQGVSNLAVRGDTVWVSEPGWVHRFSLDGDHEQSRRVDFRPPAPLGPGALVPLSDGWGLMTATMMMFRPGPPPAAELPRYLVHRGSEEMQSIPGIHPEGLVEIGRAGEQPIVVPRPFTRYDASAPAPDGASVFVVEQDHAEETVPATFRVLRLAPGGDTLQTAEVEYLPVPVSEEQAEEAIAREAEAVQGAYPSMTAALRAVRSGLEVPAHFLPVSRIFPADDGTVWLAPSPGSGSPWLILDSDLVPIAHARVPEGIAALAVAGGALWATRVDEIGWTRLLRLEVASP